MAEAETEVGDLTCSNCGAVVTEEHDFCWHCGALLEDGPPVEEKEATLPKKKASKRKRR